MTSEVMLHEAPALAAGQAQELTTLGEFTKVGWIAPAEMTYEQWEELGYTLQTIQGSLNWWIGDWLVAGQWRWGEKYAQAVAVTGWKNQRLRNAQWVAEKVDLSLRKDKLSWTHHSYVAHLEEREQAYWLARAEAEGWDTRQLRSAIKQADELSKALDELAEENGHRVEPLPGDFEEPADYYAALYGDLDPDEGPDEDEEAEPWRLAPLMSSESEEWLTTPDIIAAVQEVMGDIDLDPCSNSHENPNVPAGHHYTKEDDGLVQPWFGRVYMNPPYGRAIPIWIEKVLEEYESGRVEMAILLLPARPDTRWFRLLRDFDRCFMFGRVRFNEHENSAPFPTMLVNIGCPEDLFIVVTSALGDIYRRVELEVNDE